MTLPAGDGARQSLGTWQCNHREVRTVRLVGSIRIEADSPQGVDLVVTSKLFMATFRLGEQRIYAARCQHALRVRNGEFKIAWKKVTLVNCEDTFDALTVPF